MGRPKASELCCTICDIRFKKKNLLNQHMETHSSSKNLRKRLKNYCPPCKRSFEPDKYQVHIQLEHQCDLPKMKNSDTDNLFSCEDGFVLLSKKKIKIEKDLMEEELETEKSKSFISVSDIKIEPTDKQNEDSDWEESQKMADEKSTLKKKLKNKLLKEVCPTCGMKCKSEKGLKIHMSAHKRQQSSMNGTAQSEENTEDSDFCQSPKRNNADSSTNNTSIPLFLSSNGVNYAQTTQPYYILNASSFQNLSNNLINIVQNPVNLANQSTQNSQSVLKLKTEPTDKNKENSDWEECQNMVDEKSTAKEILKTKLLKQECSICGMTYKGERGLKIHMSAHKRQRTSMVGATQSDDNTEDGNSCQSPKRNDADIPLLLSNNELKYSQTAQPYIINASSVQNLSNNFANIGQNPMNLADQTTPQISQSVPNMKTEPSCKIQKLDCNSEKYAVWLKKFTSKCQDEAHSLSPQLCKKISLVTEDLRTALGNSEISIKNTPNYVCFKRMHTYLTEIMLNHLQRNLNTTTDKNN